MIPKTSIIITKGIHKGEVIHNHDQLTIPVSFKIKNTKNIGVERL